MALTRIKRPSNFNEVKGQERAVAQLRANIQSGNVPSVTILTGPFGTGKTTLARIIAKSLNCANPKEDGGPCCECDSCRAIDTDNSMDVMELDAASNNGVADVLRLIEGIKYAPVNGRYKVYIIDEVHRLSSQAFDTLLKTFEEPPSYVRFILCTTEVHKIPDTIISRGSKVQLEKISISVIEDTLKSIADEYNIPYEEGSLMLIAKDSDGHMRDAEKNLEDAMKSGNITIDGVTSLLGIASDDVIFDTLKAIQSSDLNTALGKVEEHISKGRNLSKLVKQFTLTLTDIVLYKRTKDKSVIYNTESYKDSVEAISASMEYAKISDLLKKFKEIYVDIQKGGDDFCLRNGLIQLIIEESQLSKMAEEVKFLKEKVEMLENALFEGTKPVITTVKDEAVVEEVKVSIQTPCVAEVREEAPLQATVEDDLVLPNDGFVPIDITEMQGCPFETGSLPGDVLEGFSVGGTVSLFGDSANESSIEVPSNNSSEEERKEDTAPNTSGEPVALTADDMFDALAWL